MTDNDSAGEHMAECPKCSQMTADQDDNGGWACADGCNLEGYQQCPRCGRLYHGTAPFCSSSCEDAALP